MPAIQELLGELGSLDKISFGCLGDDPFRVALAQTLPPGGTLLLAGVESHICVMQSALGALNHGYNVHVVSDAIGSRSPANRAAGHRSHARRRRHHQLDRDGHLRTAGKQQPSRIQANAAAPQINGPKPVE